VSVSLAASASAWTELGIFNPVMTETRPLQISRKALSSITGRDAPDLCSPTARDWEVIGTCPRPRS